MEYERFVAREAVESGLEATIEHVKAHLSSIADEDDDPDTYGEQVRVRVDDVEGGVMVTGYLDAEPVAPYLMPDYRPEDDGEFRWEDEGGFGR